MVNRSFQMSTISSHTNRSSCKRIIDRAAFTMIELIFAIVIIGISILALPLVLIGDASSQERGLIQEGIMVTTTKIAQILTYPWDANSSPGGALMSTSQVLDTPAGDADLNRNTTDFRVGHFQEALRRRMTPSSNIRNASVIPAAPIDPPTNMADFNGEVKGIDNNATTAQGYKKTYRLNTAVSYVTDNATYTDTNITFNFSVIPIAGPTNIKMVQVTTDELNQSGNWVPIVGLTSYSANIGEAEFYKRRY